MGSHEGKHGIALKPGRRLSERGANGSLASPYGALLINKAGPSLLELESELHRLGYDVMANTAKIDHALALVDSLLPDAVLIAADEFDRASVLQLARAIRAHQSCAVLILTGSADRAVLAQYEATHPHAILPYPAAPGVHDASLLFALNSVKRTPRALPNRANQTETMQDYRLSREYSRFAERFTLASARAARTGLPFAVGVVEVATVRDFDGTLSTIEADERLQPRLRETDAVLMGKGSLAFLAEDVSTEGVHVLGARIVRELSAQAARAEPRVGIAVWKSSDDTLETLLDAATHALLEARQSGAKGYGVVGAASHDAAEHADVQAESRIDPRRMLQRVAGWASLATLGWLVVHYFGIDSVAMVSQAFAGMSRVPLPW
jgi:DNA-binding NarL/FixJ family response regulator